MYPAVRVAASVSDPTVGSPVGRSASTPRVVARTVLLGTPQLLFLATCRVVLLPSDSTDVDSTILIDRSAPNGMSLGYFDKVVSAGHNPLNPVLLSLHPEGHLE